ncbi:hypothetical protein FNV62_36425 [Streptomyces sp. RLB3-17]|uniref:hypothetical protein n=1 Tax=Streptomyces sp. RLB3-17 TaxID=2594455 RepID=UPI0011648225|nr:hypothetical protein [Streptomyces sp. RLB3-17]QDO42897.1 hypothetical protein FNV62_36425 [Streptomyces sp. RLB3-17]
MTSHDDSVLLPEVIVYEGEFIDDDEPQPGAGPAPAARRRAARRVAHTAATAARFIAVRTLPGLRHAWALTVHWAALRYMTGDEIRRRIVKKQLDHYTERRDDARTARDTTLKQLSKLVDKAGEDGLTSPEKNRLRDLGAEADRRRNGLAVLNAMPFTPAQPTAEQITRWRGTLGAVRFTLVVVPALGALVTVTATAPVSGLVTGPALLGGGWWLTRHPIPLTTRPAPAELLIPELDAPADYQLDEPRTAAQKEDSPAASADPQAAAAEDLAAGNEQVPGSLAEASTSEQAAAVLAGAVRAEGRDLAEVARAVEEPWGWSFYVRFSTGSPDELNKDDIYKALITRMRLRRNGLLIEGDPDAGDSAFVRALLRDPFSPEAVGPLPYRPPLSMSIVDAADFGVAMDGNPLVFSLAGLMLLMVADSGGGKSGVMLALAEAVTACRDAVAFNLDPVGTGVGALGEAITLSACMDDELIQAVLDFLLELCSARARQRARYGWGNKWRVSEEHPAIVVFTDEWPQLSDEAKAKLVRGLLLGRKEAVWFEAGSQFGTRDYLGQAIGPKLSARLLGACRRVDVTELLGGGAIAEGYRADLLQAATHTQINDAGQIYAQGLPGMPNRPIRYQVREVTDAQAALLGTDRAAAGLPDLAHTLTEAGLWQKYQDLLARCHADSTPPPAILLTVREAFRAEQDPDALTVAQLAQHLHADDADRWGRWDNRADRLAMIGRHLRKALTDAGVELSSTRLRHLPGEPTGYLLADVKAAQEAFS